MSTATWGEPETLIDEVYPPKLLKYLLHQMMVQFSASGACLALYNGQTKSMDVRLHVRLRSHIQPRSPVPGEEEHLHPRRPTTGNLSFREQSPSLSAPALPKGKRIAHALMELEDVSPQQSEVFPTGTSYSVGQDLIGYTWLHNEAYIMRHDSYFSYFHRGQQPFAPTEHTPLWYLAVPIQEVTLAEEARDKTADNARQPSMFGVIILYQTPPGGGFHIKQRAEALHCAESIALHLQHEQQQRRQQRSSEYLQKLQEISTSFPTNVKLSVLVENIYRFVSEIVDVDSMLITLYDRDTKKMYDVFAVNHRQSVANFAEQPTIIDPDDRSVWWQVTQVEKKKLLLAPNNPEGNGSGVYDELLNGVWGDQRQAESFLLLPMRMFTRVIGSISIASRQQDAYQKEEIQVLETMVQIVTVSIENARLYDRSRVALLEAKERGELLAALNSALQSIGSVLNVSELLRNIVRVVAALFEEDMCVFFQLSSDQSELVAQAAYAPTKMVFNEHDVLPDPSLLPRIDASHDELIEQIHIPFKGTVLEHQVKGSFFYVDAAMADELAARSAEGGAIFLRETGIEKMLMVPILYQTELVGVLAVHTPRRSRLFQPREIGVLLALTAQAASAIRNAQLFEKLQETNAELERMNSLKDEFLVTASHELRTPLSAISGYSTLLKRQSNRIDAEHILRFATKIAGAAQQLTDLLTNMNEAANINSDRKKREFHAEPIQLYSLISTVVSILSINIEQRISVYVTPDLWVRGDLPSMRQVITNLLDNAAKYSPPDERIEIFARSRKLSEVSLPEALIDHGELIEHGDTPVVVVQVHDAGEGISTEEQQKIFDKFVRAQRSLTTPVRGSGLGLYICRTYIEAMGGKIWLEKSIPGEGSIFSFYLPQELNPPQPGDTEDG